MMKYFRGTLLGLLIFTLSPLSLLAWGTVTVDPNLSVSPSHILFGTVFPEEVLYKSLFISLSESFMSRPTYDDIEYHIEQLVKPKIEADAVYCKNNPTDFTRCYPTLCPYLSKEADLTPLNDTSIPAFHDPNASSSIAYGRLAKSDNDLEDNWTIDLHVPCFSGQCAQDNVVPRAYELNPALEHQIFGCDLKIVVDHISKICEACDGTTIEVNTNVVIDFNPSIPTCTGNASFCSFFNPDKSGGPTADKWLAKFDLLGKALHLSNNAKISVKSVGIGNNQATPSISIKTLCTITTDAGTSIVVNSLNKKAGDIVVQSNGSITINGEIRNQVSGTNGLPGQINIDSQCGNIIEGQSGLIQDLGSDPGGNVINIFTHDSGDITINGLVLSRAHAHAFPLTLNRPNINVGALNGRVTINANTVEPLYDEYNYGGTKYDLWGGLLSWVTTNFNPGTVQVQAKDDVSVNGHGNDPTGAIRESFGAIAAIATASSAPGGVVDVRSLNGSIVGNDRAFDVSGRNRLATNFAHINLASRGDVKLSRLGGVSSNPVVDASSPTVGDRGGKNDIRSFSGGIINSVNSLISAAVPLGNGSVQGVNNLTYCTGVSNIGISNIKPLGVLNTNCLGIPTPIF